jgi:hypothetical protein
MKKYYIILGCLQIFTAIGAIPAGLGYLSDTTGAAMGTSVKLLAKSPLTSFLVPGLFLVIVHGLGNIVLAVLSFRKKAIAGIAGLGMGIVLCLWIIIQVYWIGLSHFLQPFFLIIGLVEFALGWVIWKKNPAISEVR